MDYTGTGNTLHMRNPHVLQLVMDSLRYWVEEMHVDGFRFDLASALARGLHEVDRLGAFFDLIQQDPVVSRVKLIAEPWDVGEGGYQVGNFPPLWSEWNGKYRDWIRDYWRGEPGSLPELGARLTGSSDLYQQGGRFPHASINFVTAHDGFTLRDLVSYNDKHNEANGEDNRDGESHNRSWNCGVEGPTDDPAIEALRAAPAAQLPRDAVPVAGRADAARRRRARAHPARQQQRLLPGQRGVVGRLGERRHGPARVHAAARGAAARAPGVPPPRLVPGPADPSRRTGARRCPTSRGSRPRATEMTDEHWDSSVARSLQVFLNGHGLLVPDERGEPILDDTFLIVFHAEPADGVVVLPEPKWGERWQRVLDTAQGFARDDAARYAAGAALRVRSRSMWLLQRT